MNTLLEPFQYRFMVDAMIVGTAIGAVCAVLSCYLVLKGWSLMGDAISHAVLPGIVIAYAIGLPLAVGAFLSGLFCAVATGYIKANTRVKEDTVMGVVFTGLFALGLVLFTKIKSDLHLDHILFGNILGLESGDLRNTLIAAGVTLAIVLALRRDLLLFCFDPAQARAIGLPTKLLYYLLLSLLAMTIVGSLKAVGIILVIAMLVTPGCIAYLLTDRFDRMLVIATAAAVGSSLSGVYVSFFLNASTGACIVLIQALIFVLVLVFAPKHGILQLRRRMTAS
ncbi:Manganese transport system membrane protein MntB [Lacunisphaera limnophila]|uniref:Manganese transport system membrane protein MntB n=1 Tax=Lacunisphaera limnophila TaxID=1838286 RepID=A0A1D8AYA2_9BACT|nr:metal ABC transporter permease [Lacunisphaera limnophila]AOS45855.1 Manganese transport system membrane protein MntB [Lacunisphaera limnophila]